MTPPKSKMVGEAVTAREPCKFHDASASSRDGRYRSEKRIISTLDPSLRRQLVSSCLVSSVRLALPGWVTSSTVVDRPANSLRRAWKSMNGMDQRVVRVPYQLRKACAQSHFLANNTLPTRMSRGYKFLVERTRRIRKYF